MTDGADALRRTPGNGRHFLVTCVEQSSNDDSASDYGETATLSSVFSCGQPDETSVPSNVVFKIGDSSVFGSSVTDSTGLSLALHNNYPETSSAITGTLSANSEPSVAHMIHSHSSRFHIVTLDDNPFRRGRWLCKEKQVTDEPKTSSDPSVETSGRRKFAVQPVTTDAPTISGNGPASLSSPALVTTSTPLVSANGSGRSEHSDRMTTASIAESDSFLSSVPEILSSGSPSSVVGTSGALDSVSHPSVAPEERSQTSASGIRSKPLLALVSGGETPGQMLDSLLPSMPSPIDTVVEQLSADQILREIESQAATGGSALQSGATPSEVAIDNKIEQAMDLVKTHLLYAVREEVEVLKERIDKLERISRRLEAENRVLREHAPAEIVAQLGSLMASKGVVTGGSASSSSPLSVPLVTVVGPPNATGDGSSGAALADQDEGAG
uniref:TSC22 domain family protein 1 n=1 Tax=Trichuris muris TaxID=70415 RepID=A0A5S6R3P1_TRIMR